jgi:hypothetical protein
VVKGNADSASKRDEAASKRLFHGVKGCISGCGNPARRKRISHGAKECRTAQKIAARRKRISHGAKQRRTGCGNV